ncbi:PGPGW domain-containing protein [Oryzibacter oryziterrae]|uniref:PGPGW domain-containing protein n=1 Tax=Oryzibacter oryziterrae TaxID=2766474 RepID=UPI001F196B5E|nr:PGPGW domain-containing protein [Oryzibacter oryziterrae]
MTAHKDKPTRVRILGRAIPLPASRLARTGLGVLFVLLGLFGFLPVLGFWMVPVGLAILSVDSHWARRLRRRLDVWFARLVARWRR